MKHYHIGAIGRSAIRTLKALSLVCKLWHSVSLGYLYRHIVLHRVGQIGYLANTLRAAPNLFGPPVRQLTFACLLPDGLDAHVRHAISSIVLRCVNLKHLSFQGFADMPRTLSGEMVYRSAHGSEEPGLGKSVAARYENPTLVLWSISIPKVTLDSLTSLSVSLPSGRALPYSVALEFPSLEVLSLWIVNPYGTTAAIQPYYEYPRSWTMPKMKELRFRPTFLPSLIHDPYAIFWAYGSQLTGLDFGCASDRICDVAEIDYAVARCPRLQHLVCCLAEPPPTKLDATAMFARDLELVDIAADFADDTFSDGATGDADGFETAPAHVGSQWKTVRYIDQALVGLVPDLPHSGILPRANFVAGSTSQAQVHGLRFEVCGATYRGAKNAHLCVFTEHWYDDDSEDDSDWNMDVESDMDTESGMDAESGAETESDMDAESDAETESDMY